MPKIMEILSCVACKHRYESDGISGYYKECTLISKEIELENCYSEIEKAIQAIGDNQKVYYILNELNNQRSK